MRHFNFNKRRRTMLSSVLILIYNIYYITNDNICYSFTFKSTLISSSSSSSSCAIMNDLDFIYFNKKLSQQQWLGGTYKKNNRIKNTSKYKK